MYFTQPAGGWQFNGPDKGVNVSVGTALVGVKVTVGVEVGFGGRKSRMGGNSLVPSRQFFSTIASTVVWRSFARAFSVSPFRTKYGSQPGGAGHDDVGVRVGAATNWGLGCD